MIKLCVKQAHTMTVLHQTICLHTQFVFKCFHKFESISFQVSFLKVFSELFRRLFSSLQTANDARLKKSTSSGGGGSHSAHSPECLHGLWFNGHSVSCNSILPHRLLPSVEITGSGLIHKTHRTTLESLLQFELSNHNGGVGVRLPFSHCTVYVWLSVLTVGVLSRFIFSRPAGFA